MANPVGEVQRTQKNFSVTFISQERLGLLYNRVSVLETFHNRKKARAAEFNWLDDTFRRLGLIPSGAEWGTYAIASGVDFSGNLGVFVLQSSVEIKK